LAMYEMWLGISDKAVVIMGKSHTKLSAAGVRSPMRSRKARLRWLYFRYVIGQV
jgi:hypothetical protein